MNTITKRVPRDPDESMALEGIRTLREIGLRGEDADLYRIAASVYYAMVSRAPVDPMEDAIERKYQRDIGRAA